MDWARADPLEALVVGVETLVVRVEIPIVRVDASVEIPIVRAVDKIGHRPSSDAQVSIS